MKHFLSRAFILIFGGISVVSVSAVEDPRVFIEQSIAGLEQQQAAHSATWGLGKSDRWNIDQEAGEITFHFTDGKLVRAPIQVVGTFNPKDSTFLWAWDHPSILEPLRVHAKLAKVWGAKHNLAKWTTRKVQITEAEAWEFAAVTSRLGHANGVYRAPTSGPYVFVTFGEVSIEKSKP